MAKLKSAAKSADSVCMGSINLSSNLLQSALATAMQSVGLTGNTATGNPTGLSALSSIGQADNSQLSPFAELMNTLQQLQQSNPTKFAQVMQQIGTNLQTAAQTATANGNTAAASQLSQLSADFTNASKTGQLPNVADLAKAMGGGHHHGHGHGSSSNSASASSTASAGNANSSSAASQALSQLLSAFQSDGAQSASTDPMSIVMSTLASSGITSAI